MTMKKQFFRVKQLADQTFSRAGKTEVLTDDLQAADKHVEQIRAALMGLSKRFGNKPSELNILDSAHKEKRLKKCPEFVLGQTMLENTGEEGLMCYTLSECGKTQVALANEAVDHESKVEQYVAVPLQHILETDVPNILKHKRNLQRLILDMDSARARYHQASKHNSGGNVATKVDILKDELEEAEAKVDQCRDYLAAEMFQLMSRETDLAQTIIQYVKLQRAYHESALHCLEELIPDLECYINDNEMKPVYGYSLEEHLRVTNRKIALPIQFCISALLRLGMEEEGLFRIVSGASKLRRMKLSFDACCLTLPIVLEYKDPHVIAGALKSYLRELPEPLLTYKLYSEWMAAAKLNQIETRLRVLWEVLHKLPTANFENLRFLIKFFAVLTKNQDINKMTPHNIAIVIAPNLIWNFQEDTTTIVMDTANNSSLIVDQLITYADWFFPENIDFDRDLDLGFVNGTDDSQGSGMPRCVSNSSLSDHGESPTQGSPKPAARRKNKPAPTPPSTKTTSDKQQTHHDKRPDDKPPPTPDKPPRPLVTGTLNRVIHKLQKHEQLSINMLQTQDTAINKIPQSDRSVICAKSMELIFNKTEQPNLIEDAQNHTEAIALELIEISASNKTDCQRKVEEDDRISNVLLGYETLNIKAEGLATDLVSKSANDLMTAEDVDKIELSKSKPVPAEKPSSNLEKRKFPVAAPRNIANITLNQPDCGIEFRKKSEGSNSLTLDRNSKPAIPERPAGLARPSSLIRPHFRHSNENLDSDSGPLTLEQIHMYSVDKQQVSIIQVCGNSINESNGTTATVNLQRSPSVGSRPVSMSLSTSHVIQQVDRPEKPPRPDLPDQIRSHSRTRSEGNIIDVQTQTQTVIMPKSIISLSQQPPPATSPRIYQRPPRPQPPPPPPPTSLRSKPEHESTNL